jgi:hypothetical protein
VHGETFSAYISGENFLVDLAATFNLRVLLSICLTIGRIETRPRAGFGTLTGDARPVPYDGPISSSRFISHFVSRAPPQF